MPRTALTFRFLAEPQHVNFGGKVHGGSVMKWMDEAAYACAAGYSGRYCVTVSVSGIRFVAPIRIGELVEIDGQRRGCAAGDSLKIRICALIDQPASA